MKKKYPINSETYSVKSENFSNVFLYFFLIPHILFDFGNLINMKVAYSCVDKVYD